jgi:outer membrane protein assembly factor BamB
VFNRVWEKVLIIGFVFFLFGTNGVLLIGGTAALKNSIAYDNLNQSQGLSQNNWWPMFHHDLNHTGFSNSSAPDTNSLLWVSSAGYWLESSPAVSDGKVYIGSQDDNVYCFDAFTGEKIWSFHTGHLIVSSPAISDGKVYIGSTDHNVYCLDAYTGEDIWVFTTGWGIAQSSPAINHGKVFIGSQDNKLYCLDAASGLKLWEYTTGDYISSSPAVVDDKVYVGSMDGNLYCLDANTGTKIWEYLTGDTIWISSPAIADGKVYFGALNTKLYCISALTGLELWNYTTGDWITGTPAVTNGNVYIGSWNNKIYCLNMATGTLIWEYLTSGGISSSPVVADGKVYVGSSDNTMYCLDAETGEKIWEYVTGGQINSSPAIAEGKVYVGSMDYNVYCFGSENQPPVADFSWDPPTPGPGQIVTFDASDSYDPDGSITLYEWDWNNDGVFDESSINPVTTHVWVNPGSYLVTLQVTDNDLEHGMVSKTIGITNDNQPPKTPLIRGPARGKVGVIYNYTIVATDPNDDSLYYWIEWGDASPAVEWLGPYGSNQTITVNHTYSKKGTYMIRCQAKDIWNTSSEWGTLDIKMPLSYAVIFMHFWERFFDRVSHLFPILRHLFY